MACRRSGVRISYAPRNETDGFLPPVFRFVEQARLRRAAFRTCRGLLVYKRLGKPHFVHIEPLWCTNRHFYAIWYTKRRSGVRHAAPRPRQLSDIPQMDGFDAEGMGEVAGIEQGLFRGGSHIGETVAREKAAEMQRHILQSVFRHPLTEGAHLFR